MTASENLELVVFSLRTTVRAIRNSLRDAVQVFSARRGSLVQSRPAVRRVQMCLRLIRTLSVCPG